MDYGQILYDRDGGKARITLKRPEKRRAEQEARLKGE